MQSNPPALDAPAPALISIAELAGMLGLSRRGIERLRAAGRLGPAAINFGARCVRFRAQEVENWIHAGCPPADRWRALQKGGSRER